MAQPDMHECPECGLSNGHEDECVDGLTAENRRLQGEVEALMSPGIIEGMRRACLLRKDATPGDVLAHLKQVADSYEGREVELTAARERIEALEGALMMDTPTPAHLVLTRLADAVDHLLDDHDCDALGHEGLRITARAAREIAEALLTPEGTDR